MKKSIIFICSIIFIFIAVTVLVLNFTIKDNFKFTNVTNIGLNYYLYFNKVKNASRYEIVTYDKDSNIIKKIETDTNSATLEFDSLNHDEEYEINVIAYNDNGLKKKIKEPYKFIWNEPTFSQDNDCLMDNEDDYIVIIDGHFDKKDYILNIKENDKLIKSEKLNKNTYTLKNNIFKDKHAKYTFEIVDNSLVISTLNIYNLISPITDIKITSPSTGDMMDFNDVALSFTGGDNATNYLLELYNNTTKKLVRRKEISDKTVILSSNLFDKSSSYKVKITASYLDFIDYSKTSEVDFTINSKETLKPVYVNKNFKSIKKGTKVKLLSPDNAKIYYTLDGSDPTTNGLEYKDELTINQDTTIKAIAKEDKKNDSIVSTFNFKVKNQDKFKVYLSPSNQNANLGVSSVGYTNEMKEMNDLTNYIEKRLKEYGVTTYRNDSSMGINRWTADSTYLGVDLHLAIHSNASEDHGAYGVETWINSDTSDTHSLAELIQSNLMNIYYKKDDNLANRGVKYAKGSLGEVNPLLVPFGILIEVAHHDYESDALWIMENKELIGNTIADTILEYFQIK